MCYVLEHMKMENHRSYIKATHQNIQGCLYSCIVNKETEPPTFGYVSEFASLVSSSIGLQPSFLSQKTIFFQFYHKSYSFPFSLMYFILA